MKAGRRMDTRVFSPLAVRPLSKTPDCGAGKCLGRRQQNGRLVQAATFAWPGIAVGLAVLFQAIAPAEAFAQMGFLGIGMQEPALSNAAKFDTPGPARFEPLIGVEAGVAFLQRSADPSHVLAINDGTLTGGVQDIIETTDVLEPDAQTAYRLKFSMFNLCSHLPGLDMDATFIGSEDTTSSVTLNAANFPLTTNMVPVFFNGIPASPVASYDLKIESDFNSREWNIGYRPLPGLRLLAGRRWLRLREDYDIVQSGTGNLISGFFTDSANEASGYQIGAEATFWTNGVWRLYGRGLYGSLENEVTGEAIASNFQIRFDDEVDTQLMDLEIGVSGRISSWATVHVSYQKLVVDDFATVLNQSDALFLTGSDTQQPVYHEVEWQAIQFGLTLIW